MERPIKMYYDNEAAIKLSNNNKRFSACKHMEANFLIVKEKIRDHLVSIKHIGTDSMLIDPVAKALSLDTYREHVLKMGL